MKRLSILLLLVSAGSLFGASGNKKDYQKNPPFDYAVLAEAAGAGKKISVERFIKKHVLKPGYTVLDCRDLKYVDHRQSCYTNMVLIQDKSHNLHAVISSNSSYNSMGSQHSEDIKGQLYQVIDGWQTRHGKLSSLVGYDWGGECALNMLGYSRNALRDAQIIVFKDNYHFSTAKMQQLVQFWLASSSSLCVESSSGRKHFGITSRNNKELKDLSVALAKKQWSDVL